MPSFCASSRKLESAHIAMNAVCRAWARSPRQVRRRGKWQRHEEGELCKRDEREIGRIVRQLATGRNVRKFPMTRGAAEGEQRSKCSFIPKIPLAAAHRAQANHLAVDLAALHGEKKRRCARITAYEPHVEAEHIFRNQCKDQVARRGIVSAEHDRHAGRLEIMDCLRRMLRVDEHEIGIIRIGR